MQSEAKKTLEAPLSSRQPPRCRLSAAGSFPLAGSPRCCSACSLVIIAASAQDDPQRNHHDRAIRRTSDPSRYASGCLVALGFRSGRELLSIMNGA